MVAQSLNEFCSPFQDQGLIGITNWYLLEIVRPLSAVAMGVKDVDRETTLTYRTVIDWFDIAAILMSACQGLGWVIVVIEFRGNLDDPSQVSTSYDLRHSNSVAAGRTDVFDKDKRN